MMKSFNKLFEEILRKHFVNLQQKWDQRISKAIENMNSRIIEHLDLTLINILFGSLQETFVIVITFLVLSERNVHEWIIQLEKSFAHA